MGPSRVCSDIFIACQGWLELAYHVQRPEPDGETEGILSFACLWPMRLGLAPP